jgi:hypothetical protein
VTARTTSARFTRVWTLSEPNPKAKVQAGLVYTVPTRSVRAHLVLPHPEASDVKLQEGLACRVGHALHDKLVLRDRLLAGVALLACALSAPSSERRVCGEPPIGDLATDKGQKGLGFDDEWSLG